MVVASVLIPVRRMHGVSCNQGSRASLRLQNSGVCQKKICCNGMCEVGKIGNLECTCIEGSKPFISPLVLHHTIARAGDDGFLLIFCRKVVLGGFPCDCCIPCSFIGLLDSHRHDVMTLFLFISPSMSRDKV